MPGSWLRKLLTDRMLEYDARFIEAVEEGRRGGVSCWSTMKL
jgi:hypothetical protein